MDDSRRELIDSGCRALVRARRIQAQTPSILVVASGDGFRGFRSPLRGSPLPVSADVAEAAVWTAMMPAHLDQGDAIELLLNRAMERSQMPFAAATWLWITWMLANFLS